MIYLLFILYFYNILKMDNNNNNDSKEFEYYKIKNFINEYEDILKKYFEITNNLSKSNNENEKELHKTNAKFIFFKLKILDNFIKFAEDPNTSTSKLIKLGNFIDNNDNIKKLLNFINKDIYINSSNINPNLENIIKNRNNRNNKKYTLNVNNNINKYSKDIENENLISEDISDDEIDSYNNLEEKEKIKILSNKNLDKYKYILENKNYELEKK